MLVLGIAAVFVNQYLKDRKRTKPKVKEEYL